jgi:hypothetical protein
VPPHCARVANRVVKEIDRRFGPVWLGKKMPLAYCVNARGREEGTTRNDDYPYH